MGWWCSDLGQDDVAADDLRPNLDVVGALLGLTGALEGGADLARDGGDVGPHGYAGRDADADVARRALGRHPPAARRGHDDVAGAGGHADVAAGLADLDVARAGL